MPDITANGIEHLTYSILYVSQDLLELIAAKIDVNILDVVTGDALIHIIMKKKRKHERLDFLLTLLIHARVDVNLRNRKGRAALHMSVEVRP